MEFTQNISPRDFKISNQPRKKLLPTSWIAIIKTYLIISTPFCTLMFLIYFTIIKSREYTQEYNTNIIIKDNINQINTEYNKILQQHSALTNRNIDLQKENKSLEDSFNSYKSENINLKKAREDFDQEYKTLSRKLNSAKDVHYEWINDYDANKIKLNEAKKDVSLYQDWLENYFIQYEKWKKRYKNLTNMDYEEDGKNMKKCDSKIIVQSHITWWDSWLGDSNTSYQLLYRASEFKFSVREFHKWTDDDKIDNTLVIIMTGDNDVFGGFSFNNWSPSDLGFKPDENAFLFNLNTETKYDNVEKLQATYPGKGFGPMFGNGDIIVWGKNGETRFPSSYGLGARSFALTNGKMEFVIKRVRGV